jgi:hypothetical protein
MVSIEPSGLRKQERNDNLPDGPDSNETARNLVIDQTNLAVSYRYYQSYKIRYDTNAVYWHREPRTELT